MIYLRLRARRAWQLVALCCASGFLVGCGSAVAPAIGTAPSSHALSRYVPNAASKKKTAPLKQVGGTIAIPRFAGFKGRLPYARNDAKSGVTLTAVNSGGKNLSKAPVPQGVSVILFVSAQISGRANVAFKASTAQATIQAASLGSGSTYSVYLYQGKKQVGKIAVGTPAKHRLLTFATPLSSRQLAPGEPLVIELAQQAKATLTVSPTSLSFENATPQTFSAQETGYTGKFTATSSDTSVATVKAASAAGPTATFTVTPTGGGKATITVSDNSGDSADVKVGVTGGVIIVNRKAR